SVERFKQEGRSPLTVDEGIALILQYSLILKDHNIDLAGSRILDIDDRIDRVGDMVLVNMPTLGWSNANVASLEFGSASCLYRL
ncbi:MAG: hypothetical protein HYW78_00420, partial [Parcubacteria group bacterium]|nr:hypothetical protein [Parcubacteria group bacterium]